MNEPKAPPLFDHDAEKALTGNLLLDKDVIIYVEPIVSPEDFQNERYREIYTSIVQLHKDRKPSDLVTLSDHLRERNKLDFIGGPEELTNVINSVPLGSTSHGVHYAKIIHKYSLRRQMLDVAGRIAQMAHDESTDLTQQLDEAEQMVLEIASSGKGNTVSHISRALGKVNHRLELATKNDGAITGIETGLADLDRITGGLHGGDMIILAARPGMGKTTLAISLLLNIARQGLNIAKFSLEMSDEQIASKLLANEAQIDSRLFRTGQLSEEQWAAYTKAEISLSEMGIYIDDTPAINVAELKHKARKLYATEGIDLLIVDYLQLMTGAGKTENRQQEVSEISRGIKALARELNIPIIALSQLSREVEKRKDKRPQLSDLRESGSLEQDSDLVLFIYRDDVYNPDTQYPNIAELTLAKHRAGPTCVFSVFFRGQFSQFVNLETRVQPLNYGDE